MKVLYCPPGADPMEIARESTRRRGGFSATKDVWVGAALIIFVAFGFLAGPFKKDNDPVAQQSQPVAVAVNVTAPIATPTPPVFCSLPGGGMIEHGDDAWVDEGERVTRYRCDGGQMVPIEEVGQ
jgi:hypothetical protein